jgi:ABC-type cobalamin/Fe3+-siderophores transport system ATPase subunit
LELLSITVTGYKRFKTKTSLQTNGKLIALLGPNEAGKSSLLDVIAHLAHGGEISIEEQSRGGDPKSLRIVGRFFLNETELVAAGLSGQHSMVVTKKVSGHRTFGFDPSAPNRDISHRKPLVTKLNDLVSNPRVVEQLNLQDEELASTATALAKDLSEADETLDSSVLEALGEIHRRLEAALSELSRRDVDDVLNRLKSAIKLETEPTPLNRAFNALKDRVPQMLLFDEDARDLASSYSLSQLREKIPPALANLAEVANLDFFELFAAIDAGNNARITTIERGASRTLSEKFGEAWGQSGLEVALRIQADTLEVQIVNAHTEFTPLAERSDGLRQFVALQMFATRNHVDQPILLIDEADQRLHYDAQADLVQMLGKQQLTPKVIYTTHSAGCLPEDLGNGVRTIIPSENGSSTIVPLLV